MILGGQLPGKVGQCGIFYFIILIILVMLVIVLSFDLSYYFQATTARVAQLVEHHLAKVAVASSSLVSRSTLAFFLFD